VATDPPRRPTVMLPIQFRLAGPQEARLVELFSIFLQKVPVFPHPSASPKRDGECRVIPRRSSTHAGKSHFSEDDSVYRYVSCFGRNYRPIF